MSIGHVNPALADVDFRSNESPSFAAVPVSELSVFGSILGDDFGPESDVDFLVVFQDDDFGPWVGKLDLLEKRPF